MAELPTQPVDRKAYNRDEAASEFTSEYPNDMALSGADFSGRSQPSEDGATLDFIIKSKTGEAYHEETGTRFLAQRFELAVDADGPVSRLRIMIEQGATQKDVQLPDEITGNFLSFLVDDEDWAKEPCDCAAFVCGMMGLPYTFGSFSMKDWRTSLLGSEPLPAGSIVGCFTTVAAGDECQHIAICLGGDLYLSKFGVGGPLIVCSAAEMLRGFGADKLFRLRPANSKV